MQQHFCFGWLESSEFVASDDELGISIPCKLIICTDIAFAFAIFGQNWKTKQRKNWEMSCNEGYRWKSYFLSPDGLGDTERN